MPPPRCSFVVRFLAASLLLALGACGSKPIAKGDGGQPEGDGGGGGMDAGCQETLCGSACVNLSTDPQHCGSCTSDCTSLPGVNPAGILCAAGVCDFAGNACQTGLAHCASAADAGCDTNITASPNCGACGVTCADPTPVCTLGTNGMFSCASGCSAQTPTLCNQQCVNTNTNPAFCGNCTTVCQAPTDGAATCDGGVCGFGCVTGFHVCGAACASNNNPLSCGASCSPCSSPANASATCDAGTCGFACMSPFANCDGNPDSGCAVNTGDDVSNCGACANACNLANATSACDAGQCVVATCANGFGDCDNNPDSGCETNLNANNLNCGSCANACGAANGSASCDAGSCGVTGCSPGFADCDGLYNDGCEVNTNTNPAHCGSCTNVCTAANATPGCDGGGCVIGACNSGFADCNGLYTDGCEINTNTNPAHCGSCSNACTAANATPGCDGGGCVVGACNSGFADCNGLYSDGCEVNTNTDTTHCGSCANACSVANGTPACNSGSCAIASCNSGFADCNGLYTDGCEDNTNTDPNHCGTCANACTVANGTPTCSGGACKIAACNPGFADCDMVYGNGCETSTSGNVNNCGACGNVCSVANGTPSCSGGTCKILSCNPGWADCDGVYSNGCETNLNTTPSHCGTCGNSCSVPNGTPTCSAGACAIGACNAGFADCDMAYGDGCEVNIAGDVNHCGTCGTVCSVSHGTPGCAGGTCTIASCNVGFGDCDAMYADGCETNTTSDPNHCGSCANACSVPNGTPGCTGGACQIAACNAGFADCDGVYIDGCEINTTNDPSHCGSCGNNCSTACTQETVASVSCTASACVDNACPAGFYNEDASCSDGCECKSANNPTTCGAALSLGNIAIGQTTQASGNLVPTGQVAWYSVTFTGNPASLTYHPQISLTANPGNEYQFSVFFNCTGSALACGVEGGSSVGLTAWEVQWVPGAGNTIPMPAVGAGGNVWIEVFRKAGAPTTCNNYTLQVGD